jgi:hypothetical protein
VPDTSSDRAGRLDVTTHRDYIVIYAARGSQDHGPRNRTENNSHKHSLHRHRDERRGRSIAPFQRCARGDSTQTRSLSELEHQMDCLGISAGNRLEAELSKYF